jgi:hypothetical protein
MRFYSIHPPFLPIRTLNHILQITAILKLPKLPACPLPVIATQSQRGEGRVRGPHVKKISAFVLIEMRQAKQIKMGLLYKNRAAPFIRLRRKPRLRAVTNFGVQARPMAVDAVGHSLWRRTMNAKRITLRSLVRRRVCFGGFRRRTWRYHGLCPWGSILEEKDLIPLLINPDIAGIFLAEFYI